MCANCWDCLGSNYAAELMPGGYRRACEHVVEDARASCAWRRWPGLNPCCVPGAGGTQRAAWAWAVWPTGWSARAAGVGGRCEAAGSLPGPGPGRRLVVISHKRGCLLGKYSTVAQVRRTLPIFPNCRRDHPGTMCAVCAVHYALLIHLLCMIVDRTLYMFDWALFSRSWGVCSWHR